MKFKIYCINLYERSDRYEFMKKQFKKYNLDVSFIRNYKHKLGGKYGCFESNIQCLKDAKKNNLDVCLVLEDDIQLEPNCNFCIQYCLNFLKKNNKNIDILFGDCRYIYFNEKYTNEIYSGKSTGSYCYFLHKKSINKILKTYTKSINTKHYDAYLYELFNKSYILIKPLVKLKPFGSDNDIWSTNLFININQKMANYTVLHFILRNIIVKWVFVFLIKMKLNKIKNFFINKLDKLNKLDKIENK